MFFLVVTLAASRCVCSGQRRRLGARPSVRDMGAPARDGRAWQLAAWAGGITPHRTGAGHQG